LIGEWQCARNHHRWAIGRYVIMPDHVHFFACRNTKQKPYHGSSVLGRHGPAERSKKPDRSRRQRLQRRDLFGNANSSIICYAPARATAKNGIMFARIPCEAVLSLPLTIGLTPARSSDSNSNRSSSLQLVAAPNHGDGSRQAAAHVEGQIALHIFDLPRTSLIGEMLISFDNLAHTGRADRMPIAD